MHDEQCSSKGQNQVSMDMCHQRQSPTRPTVCKARDTDGDGIPTNKEFKMLWACFTCHIINQLGHARLEKSPRLLAMASAVCCRTSRYFDTRIFHLCHEYAGLQLRVHTRKLFFLFLNQNIIMLWVLKRTVSMRQFF